MKRDLIPFEEDALFLSENQPQVDKRLTALRLLNATFRANPERPDPRKPQKVGIYIRYNNVTDHENYLDLITDRYRRIMERIPQWTLVDFYVDKGGHAVRMTSLKDWSRLLQDCEDGKVDLILGKKVSDISKNRVEMTMCASFLAALEPPVGIYFESDDLYTLANYHTADFEAFEFFPDEYSEAMAEIEAEKAEQEGGGLLETK